MAIPEDRMSTSVVYSDWLTPDERSRELTEDYEQGPIALNNTSQGLKYQPWHLEWDFVTGNMVVTPEVSGSPSTVITVPNVTQCSFAFDQNAHVSIAYTANGLPYLYWYDTLVAGWVTTPLPAGCVTPMLTLDDKRQTQMQANDIILWYTKQEVDQTWSLFRRLQRERYANEKKMLNGTAKPYLYKLGMNAGLRLQIGMSEVVL